MGISGHSFLRHGSGGWGMCGEGGMIWGRGCWREALGLASGAKMMSRIEDGEDRFWDAA